MIPLSHTILLSAVLFAVGTVGFLVRRSAVMMLVCVEIMLNAANIAFIAFARHHLSMAGHIWVFVVITVAAGEAAIGLALIVALARERGTIQVDELRSLKG
ncbi:MAG: NADH-quinone oxidoreductase subunit NuoK [Nitrospirae bacterium]|nr:NADH-quinone oxidoreductase subunit NuoK [Nitrospirota bacterium]